MTVDLYTAQAEMLDLIIPVWTAGAQAAIEGDYLPLLIMPMQEPATIPDETKYFGRCAFQVVDGGRDSIGGADGSRRSAYAGLYFIQLFGPMGDARVWVRINALAQLALGAIRDKKTPSGVWLRNERSTPLQPQDKRQRWNVVAEFQFKEVH